MISHNTILIHLTLFEYFFYKSKYLFFDVDEFEAVIISFYLSKFKHLFIYLFSLKQLQIYSNYPKEGGENFFNCKAQFVFLNKMRSFGSVFQQMRKVFFVIST